MYTHLKYSIFNKVKVSNEDLHQFVVFTEADTFMITTRDIVAYWFYHVINLQKNKRQLLLSLSCLLYCTHAQVLSSKWINNRAQMQLSLQRVRIARNADRCTKQRDSVRLSVCPSVRPSVTFRYFVQTNEELKIRSCGFRPLVRQFFPFLTR